MDTCHRSHGLWNLWDNGHLVSQVTPCGQTVIIVQYSNNQGSIFIGSNSVQEKQTKYINICYHYICEYIEDNKVSVVFIPGNNNLADMFTKNLDRLRFVKFQEQLGLTFGPTENA